ncbi:MAG: transposase [Candidatus Competibacteraceae bacterium]
MDGEVQLITLYEFVCKHYREQVWVYCQRFSPFVDLTFTDEEVLCIYLWGVLEKQREVKDIYDHTRRHLGAWLPHLPSYGGYVQRLNRVAGVFAPRRELGQQTCPHTGVLEPIRLLDSLPIKVAHAKCSSRARVAPDLGNQGYCASKDEYYYGVKVHLLGLRRPGTLPLPEYIGLTPASAQDRAAFRQIAPQLQGGEVYRDKAYIDELLRQLSQTEQAPTLWTPVKKAKGQAYLDPFGQWLSTAVSRVRQPIESLFNWLEEKTGIQRASKVRSYNGLLVHVFGRLAAAMWLLLTKAQSA